MTHTKVGYNRYKRKMGGATPAVTVGNRHTFHRTLRIEYRTTTKNDGKKLLTYHFGCFFFKLKE